MNNQVQEKKITELLSKLTLEEKIGMIHGSGLFRTKAVERLGIPAVKLSDGPMGVRQEFQNDDWTPLGYHDDYVTYLPSNSALAATWNRELAYQVGCVLGEEARGRGKDVILAPGINIKRSPLCGRNFEYMSEDPYLTGEMAVPVIQGIQKADIAACVKHFAMNNQETERLSVEVEVSERALREIYLPAFEKAVKQGGSYSLMAAYNRYRGEHCCESKRLLNRILREEWGYDGMIVSDWGGVHRTKEAAESGLDMEMSVTDNFDGYCLANPLKEAVEKGKLSEELVDEKVKNILRMMLRLHMLEPQQRESGSYNTTEHRRHVREAARESVVLLKNEEGKLPLIVRNIRKLLVIGDNADRIHSNGGGSAEIKALYEITPLMGIKMLLGGNTEVTFVPGYVADDCEVTEQDVNWQADSLDNGGVLRSQKTAEGEIAAERQKRLREDAVQQAANPDYDAVILIGGQNHKQDLEGHDRPDMKLPYGQDKLIQEVLAARGDTIVIMVSGTPVEMPWIQDTRTFVWHWYAGMDGGIALAEVLFGKVNPSGRLPETFPVSHLDCSAHSIGEYPGGSTVAYREDVFVGYRHYDTRNVPVQFPFGFGLSYTEFNYSDLQVKTEGTGEYAKVTVLLTVTNIGNRTGKEVVQIYVGKEESAVERPRKELRAFAKVELEAGESDRISIVLEKEAFACYDEAQNRFVVEPGRYIVYAGKSVRDICLEGECVL